MNLSFIIPRMGEYRRSDWVYKSPAIPFLANTLLHVLTCRVTWSNMSPCSFLPLVNVNAGNTISESLNFKIGGVCTRILLKIYLAFTRPTPYNRHHFNHWLKRMSSCIISKSSYFGLYLKICKRAYVNM